MKTRSLVYCRVSSQRQVDHGNGLGSQEQRCRMYAKNKNYEIEKIFLDEAISGALFQRPAMQRLIQYLDEHQNEEFVIIFDDLSRFARDVKIHIQLKAELVSRGAKLECLNFNFDDSEESEFAELILAASNQYQRKSNRRQVIQKMKARLEKGYWPFFPPLGLKNENDPIHGRILKPVEPYASILKEAIEKFRDGILITQEDTQLFIASKYKELGINRKISLNGAKDILTEYLYAGYIEYPKWNVPFKKAQHEAFISLETYNIVQARLQKRTNKWIRRDYSIDFPLRPHVLCAGCNRPMTGSWNKGRAKNYPNYFCHTRQCKYQWKVVNRHIMEEKFEKLLLSVKLDPLIVDLAKDVFIECWETRKEEQIIRIENARNEKQEIEQKINGYLDRISKTSDESLIELYEKTIRDLTIRIRELDLITYTDNYTEKNFGTAIEKVFDVLKKPLYMWKSDDYNNKRAILFMYFEERLKYDYFNGFGTASLSYPINLINDIASQKNSGVEMAECDSASKDNLSKTSTSVVDS